MGYKGLREWVQEVDRMGQLKRIDGADWDLEIGALVEIIGRENRTRPATLFDRIKGYPTGYRVLAGLLNNMSRLALTTGMAPDISGLQFVQQWRNRMRNLAPIPPVRVSWGPVMENVMAGDEVDLTRFPAPKWHAKDGGRYIGTASVTITKDPDSDWVNLGVYRVMVHDRNTLAFFVSPGKQARIHREKYFAMGVPCPVAVSFGQDPLLFMMAGLQMPPGVCEYDIAGGIKGEPIEVVRGELTGLLLPAHAEIVIEGESLPSETRVEGPFGEFTGYYGSAERPEPFIRVKRVLYRNNPIITGALPYRPPNDTSFFYDPCASATIWENMEKAGIPDVRGVWMHQPASCWAFVVVSIKQRYPGHARQAGLVASQVQGGAYMGRYVVVVDDDIDPSDINDVLWAIGTRSDPARSVEILHRCWSGPLDAAIPRDQKGLNSRLIMDACKPYEWLADFPQEAGTTPELRARVFQRFGQETILQ